MSIEFKNLTNDRIGNKSVEGFRLYVEAYPDHEIIAWATNDGDTDELFNLTGGRERSAGELLDLADWISDEFDTDTDLILSDDQLNEYADQRLESYLDECILTEVPEQLRCYFDGAAWKRDALMSDGVLHCAGLAEVDSVEYNGRSISVQGLYRQA